MIDTTGKYVAPLRIKDCRDILDRLEDGEKLEDIVDPYLVEYINRWMASLRRLAIWGCHQRRNVDG